MRLMLPTDVRPTPWQKRIWYAAVTAVALAALLGIVAAAAMAVSRYIVGWDAVFPVPEIDAGPTGHLALYAVFGLVVGACGVAYNKLVLGLVDAFDAIRRLRSAAPKVRVLLFSAFDNPTYVARAVAAGAHDYVLKTANCATFLAAIGNALTDGQPTHTGAMRTVAASMKKRDVPADAPAPLTARELQALRMVAMGLSNQEIANAMTISVETVKEHVQNMLRKIALHDRTQAAVWAIRNGLA
jgi:DNA-binding NarL/FixJ family response regulator